MSERPPTPLLDMLAHHGVFRTALRPDGKLRIYGQDDRDCELTANQVADLVGELLALVCVDASP